MSEQKKSSKTKLVLIIFIIAIVFVIYKYWDKIKPLVNSLLLQMGIDTGKLPDGGTTDPPGSIYDENDPREVITGLSIDGEELTIRGFELPANIKDNEFPFFVIVKPSMTLVDLFFAGQMLELTYLDETHLNYCGYVDGILGNYPIPYSQVVSNTLKVR